MSDNISRPMREKDTGLMTVSKKICFIGMDNLPILNPQGPAKGFGGESVQQTLLARAFRDLGYDVSMIVQDHGQANGEVIDGIRVWKTFPVDAGIPIVRFVYPRITTVVSAMKQANADIYYQSCALMLTGLVAWFCKKYERKFIFRLAHDSDCVPGQQLIRFWRDRKIYEYGLRRADLVAAQTFVQSSLLTKHYNLASQVVNMAVEPPAIRGDTTKDIDILWINNIRSFKRPDLAIEIARRLPNRRVVMIGGPHTENRNLYQQIKQQAATIQNLNFVGAVPYDDIGKYFVRARVFVNTSDSEGFPNSFLQAWIRGVPVVSFFDPDSLILSRKLGRVPANLQDMLFEIDSLLQDSSKHTIVANRAKSFAKEHYSALTVARRYEELIAHT